MLFCFFFFFNDTATTEIYTLSLHDALPISQLVVDLVTRRERHLECHPADHVPQGRHGQLLDRLDVVRDLVGRSSRVGRSEEHTSELQSRPHLVCRLLLEKKKKESQ